MCLFILLGRKILFRRKEHALGNTCFLHIACFENVVILP